MPVNIYDRLALGALALVAVIAALTFRDYGLGWDDYTHSQYGELLLAFYASGFKDTRALSFVNLYLYGGGFDMAAALLAKILPFGLFETRRLLGAAVGILGLAVTWRIARRVGGPLAGLIALLLLAACPLYYGHMFINPKDAPFAVAMAVLLLGLVRTLEEYPKPSWTSVFILGAGFGLSIGSRIMGGFGVALLRSPHSRCCSPSKRANENCEARRRGWAHACCGLSQASLLAYAVMALVWPWGAIDPLNPIRAIGIFSHFFEKPWQELFEGALLTPPEMPRRYLPELLMRQLPELFLIAALAGVLDALLTAMRRDATPQRRALHLCVALAAVLPIAVTVLTRPAMYNGIRHFLFVLPPLAVAGGLAASLLIERANRYGGVIRAMILAVAIGGMALPVIGMVRLHPYQYVCFNHVTGGVQRARV